MRLVFSPEFREGQKAANDRWKADNRDWLKAYHRQRRYGLSTLDYELLLISQGGVCAICGKPPAEDEELVVDHDHACCPSFRTNTKPGCGRCVRGLLHSYCNKVEGMVSDEILEGLLRYRESRRVGVL